MAKILNANIDINLGGENASNEVISSQKAIKTYVDTGLEGKQNTLVQGANIVINGSTISATDTTYKAGEGISIINGTISATGSASFFAGNGIDITNGTISAISTSSITSGSTDLLTSGGAYLNLVRRLSDSSATGSLSQGIYVDANGQVQVCEAVTSSYDSAGTAPINGTALASALVGKLENNSFVVDFGSTYGSYTILDGTTGLIPYQRVNSVNEYNANTQLKFWKGTQTQFNSITVKDTETLYYVIDN